jgi:hypothetical protein
MTDTKSKLKNILSRLINCIDGKWFVSDGALLGIEREGDLLNHDNDIDLYLLPNASINVEKLKENGLALQKYYMDTKIYDPEYQKKKLNTWIEYIRYKRVDNKKLSRKDLIILGSKDYKSNKINAEFTLPYIDIYYLQKENNKYVIPNWDIYYNDFELNDIETIEISDMKINIPNGYVKEILQRLYGNSYMIEDKKFQHL